ncbi:hypothetical protein Nmel_013738, partial [Mimus melanotis]
MQPQIQICVILGNYRDQNSNVFENVKIHCAVLSPTVWMAYNGDDGNLAEERKERLSKMKRTGQPKASKEGD